MTKLGHVLAQPRKAVLLDAPPHHAQVSVKGGKSHEPPNSALQATAGPFAGSGLKPLFPPEMHGVMPLADSARRLDVSCGKRPAALPPAHGASPRLSAKTLGGRGCRRREATADTRHRGREIRRAVTL